MVRLRWMSHLGGGVARASACTPATFLGEIPSMSSRSHTLRSAVLSIEPLEERLALDATSFVKALYRDVLNRTPDTQGLNFWVQRLQSGSTNLQVATFFWESAEHRGLEVDQYYQTYLNR